MTQRILSGPSYQTITLETPSVINSSQLPLRNTVTLESRLNQLIETFRDSPAFNQAEREEIDIWIQEVHRRAFYQNDSGRFSLQLTFLIVSLIRPALYSTTGGQLTFEKIIQKILTEGLTDAQRSLLEFEMSLRELLKEILGRNVNVGAFIRTKETAYQSKVNARQDKEQISNRMQEIVNLIFECLFAAQNNIAERFETLRGVVIAISEQRENQATELEGELDSLNARLNRIFAQLDQSALNGEAAAERLKARQKALNALRQQFQDLFDGI